MYVLFPGGGREVTAGFLTDFCSAAPKVKKTSLQEKKLNKNLNQRASP